MSNNNDLDLSAHFNYEDFVAQTTAAQDALDGVAVKADQTAQRVSAAAERMGESWSQERSKEEAAASSSTKKLAEIQMASERADKSRVDSAERANEKIRADYEKLWANLLREREKADRQQRAIDRAHVAALKDMEKESFLGGEGGNQLKHGLRTASILSGIRDSRSIDAFLGGFGGGVGIAGIGGALAVGGAFNLVKNEAKQAEDLKKISDAMGLTITQAGKLSYAANLAGEDLSTMASASARLAEALENPGTIGKKAAEGLIELGVSLRQGPGAAFEEAGKKLAAIKDPAQQATIGVKIFGQQWRAVMETFSQLPNVGQQIDENLNKKLVEANENIKNFSNSLHVFFGEGAGALVSFGSAIKSVAVNVTQMMAGMGNAGALADILSGTTKGQYKSASDQWNLGDPTRLKKLLNDNSKVSLQERLAKAKKAQADAEMLAHGDAKNGAPDSIYNEDYSKVTAARKEVERLEAAIKAADKAARNAQDLPELLARWHDRAAGLGETSAVAHLDEQYKKDVRQFGLKPFTSSWSDITANYGLLRADAVKKQQDQLSKQALELAEAKDRMDAAMSAASSKSPSELSKAVGDPTNPLFNFGRPLPALQAPSMLSARNQNALGMAFARGTAELNQALNPDMERSKIAKENLEIRLQEVDAARQLAIEEANALKPAQQQLAIEKANTEATIQRYKSVVEYETEIANIRHAQLNETRSFATGFFNASISGQPGAGGNFLRSWGRGITDKIIGNAAANTFGTFESKLTLQRNSDKPGLLSDGKGNLTFMGKLLHGTPFGIDAASAKLDPKLLAQDKNTNALDNLTKEVQGLITAIGQASGIDTSALAGAANGAVQSTPKPSGNSANVVLSVASSGAGLAKRIQSGDITGSLQDVSKLIGMATPKFAGESPVFSGATHSAGNSLDLAPVLGAVAGLSGNSRRTSQAAASSAGLFSNPFAGLTQSFNRIANLVGSPGGTPTFLPSGIVGSDDDSLPYNGPAINYQIPNIGGSTNSGGYTPPAGSYDPTATLSADPGGIRTILKSMGYSNVDQAATDINAAAGIAKTASKFGSMGQGAKDAASGNTLSTIFDSDAGGYEKLGAGLAAGGAVAGGTLEAIQGFGKGGARGAVQGVGGVLAAAAPFTGPAAPFVEGGAALMGLISSLFPDPRQQRIKQQQQTLVSNAYLEPAAKDYDFSSGNNAEGFSYGMGGSLREGGPTANYTFQISALDAGSFVQWGNKNPSAMAQIMQSALSNGANSAVEAQLAWNAAHSGFFG